MQLDREEGGGVLEISINQWRDELKCSAKRWKKILITLVGGPKNIHPNPLWTHLKME